MDSLEERPRSVVMLMWIYLLAGLIVLTVGIIAAFDKSVAISDTDMTFIRFFMIFGSILSLLVLAMFYKAKACGWYLGAAVALIKLAYCVFLAVSEPGYGAVLVIALIEAAVLGLVVSKPTRDFFSI